MNSSWTNESLADPPTADEEGGNLAARVAMGIGLYLLAMVTCVGNGMVIQAIRTEKRLRKVSNLFLMSLAVADLVVGVFVMPVSAVYVLTDRWYLGVWMCKAWLSIDYCASTASIFNLFVLSLDRYWSITSPLKYLRRRTKKRAFLMIAAAWALSLLWILPITGWSSMVDPEGLKPSQTPESCDTEFADNITFKVTAAVANFYVPTLSMLYIYGRIFRTIRQRSRNDLGEVTTASRRPQQVPTIVSDNGDSTSLPGVEIDVGLEPATGTLERGSSTLTRNNPRRFRWSRSAPGILQAAGSTQRRRHDHSLIQFYETLTVLELHGGEIDVGATQTTSHYIDVKVQVEYVGDSQSNRRHGSEKVVRHPEVRALTKTNSSTSTPPSVLISQKERKAARQLGVIMCAFIVCWLPYFIVFMVVAVCPDCIADTLFKITLWLGYMNSTLNPVLYPLCNANFRRAFAKMLNVNCCRTSPCQHHQTYPMSGLAISIQQPRF